MALVYQLTFVKYFVDVPRLISNHDHSLLEIPNKPTEVIQSEYYFSGFQLKVSYNTKIVDFYLVYLKENMFELDVLHEEMFDLKDFVLASFLPIDQLHVMIFDFDNLVKYLKENSLDEPLSMIKSLKDNIPTFNEYTFGKTNADTVSINTFVGTHSLKTLDWTIGIYNDTTIEKIF
jgi:hypothetical protein